MQSRRALALPSHIGLLPDRWTVPLCRLKWPEPPACRPKKLVNAPGSNFRGTWSRATLDVFSLGAHPGFKTQLQAPSQGRRTQRGQTHLCPVSRRSPPLLAIFGGVVLLTTGTLAGTAVRIPWARFETFFRHTLHGCLGCGNEDGRRVWMVGMMVSGHWRRPQDGKDGIDFSLPPPSTGRLLGRS